MPRTQREVAEGDSALEFSLPSQQGGTVALSDFRGKKWVILYFYPKDNTPGCTQSACDFRDLYPQILKARGAILGVSLDPITSHHKFSSKFSLPFALLSDSDAAVSKIYGVYKEKSLYGRKFWGIERSTFLIDPEGVIRKALRKVKVNGHALEVLSILEGQGKTAAPKPRLKRV